MKRLIIGGLAAFTIVGLVGAPVAGADVQSYLDVLHEAGVYAPGADEECYDYPGDDGCSRRYVEASSAMFTGEWACDKLIAGESVASVAYELANGGDGLVLTDENAKILVRAASAQLCKATR